MGDPTTNLRTPKELIMFKYFLIGLLSLFPLNVVEISTLQAEEKTSTQFYPVGELGDLWQFPSDHLPVGGTIGNIHFTVWNILDTRYLHHIVDNGQGLRDSMIMQCNHPVAEGNALTERESIILENILTMVAHSTYPRALIALEETGLNVYQELQNRLPARMKLIPSTAEQLGHGDIFIYDAEVFDFADFMTERYKVHPGNTYMTLTLREKVTRKIYRFVQSHVPGGPVNSAPARQELTHAVLQDFDPLAVTIVMGDMNRSPDYFLNDFESAAVQLGMEKQPFINLWVPYATHINTQREASWIDNIFVAMPDQVMNVHVSADETEFFDGMKAVLELLKKGSQ